MIQVKKLSKKISRFSKRELQDLYREIFGNLALENAIENRYRKYDYIVRLEDNINSNNEITIHF